MEDQVGLQLEDKMCPICHGEWCDKSIISPCQHAFCFGCIMRWNSISKSGCPVCRTSFHSLRHNIKSECDFTRLTFPRVNLIKDESEDRRGRTHESSRRRRRSRGYYDGHGISSSSMRRRTAISTSIAGSHRIRIYEQGLRALRLTSGERRRGFFQINREDEVRVQPWIMRELELVLPEGIDATLICNLVCTLLHRSDVCSELLYDELVSFLHDHTETFIHELECFVSCPYFIDTYDRLVQYPSSSSSATTARQASCDQCSYAGRIAQGATCPLCATQKVAIRPESEDSTNINNNNNISADVISAELDRREQLLRELLLVRKELLQIRNTIAINE